MNITFRIDRPLSSGEHSAQYSKIPGLNHATIFLIQNLFINIVSALNFRSFKN